MFAEQASLLSRNRWHGGTRGCFGGACDHGRLASPRLGELVPRPIVRVGSWDSLSIMVIRWHHAEIWPVLFPTAMALATILMVVTLLVLAINERARAWRTRHDV